MEIVQEPRYPKIDLSTIDFADYRDTDRLYTGVHSGTLMQISVHKDEVGIEDTTPYHEHRMVAGVREDGKLRTDGKRRTLIYFTLRTIDQITNKKHPDFRAGEFVKKAFAFLENENGQIEGMQFYWVKPDKEAPISTNYERYKQSKQSLLNTDPHHDKRRASVLAAFQTWSGENVAIPHGFTWVVIMGDSDQTIAGTFYKDDPRTFLPEYELTRAIVGSLREFSQEPNAADE